MEPMNTQPCPVENQVSWRSSSGQSILETLVVVALAALLSAIAIPQMISARRLLRASQLSREVATHMRYARQQAMSQRQAFTFQYDDVNKQIVIIDHNARGASILSDPSYPNTAGSTTVLTVPLTTGGSMPASELSFGIPSAVPSAASTLDDTATQTSLASNKINITFQPDGTVVDANGNFTNRTLFFYNNKAAIQTAVAISVLGAAGRVKVWRYDQNASKFAE
jgi:Tfp pilus assembly protein FimT